MHRTPASPPLQRDVCSSSVHVQRFPFGSDVGIGSRLLAGCTTGAMAVALAQPTDVVKVRFQAQTSTSGPGRRYQGTMDAYKTIAKEEGIRGLWRGNICFKRGVCQFFSLCITYVFYVFYVFCPLAGTGPNIARSAIVTCTELVTYDLIKDALLKSTPLTGESQFVMQYDTVQLLDLFICPYQYAFTLQITYPATSHQHLVLVSALL